VERFILLVTLVDCTVFFYLDVFFSVFVLYADYAFQVLVFVIDQYFVSFESVFFSLREFWPNSAGSRSFVIFYGWLIFICLLNKKFRSGLLGKPPTVPLIPGRLMDLYQ